MTMVYKRLNDYKGMLFHLEKIIKSNDFIVQDLCNYGYWRCFDKNWSQPDFFEFGKFLNDNLNEYTQDEVVKLSNIKNKKIKIGILSSDIANYMPSTKPTSTLVAKMINPALLLANCYLHGKYSNCSILLKGGNSNSDVIMTGDYADGFLKAKKLSYNVLKKYFRKYGAYSIPGSLKISNLGSDGHFVGSIPMMNEKLKNNNLSSDINGQINGLNGVYAVDGASLPVLPTKHPSYAIMANADRIGQNIVRDIRF